MTYRRKAFLMHDVNGLLGVLDAAVAQAQEAAPPGRKISRQGLGARADPRRDRRACEAAPAAALSGGHMPPWLLSLLRERAERGAWGAWRELVDGYLLREHGRARCVADEAASHAAVVAALAAA